MQSAIAEHGRFKALLGLRHWQGFARIAVMSDVVQARLIGRLESSPYAAREARIGGLFSRHTPLKLLVDLREFDGWRGLAALGDHLSLVREHRRGLSRVAVVGNQAWQHLAQRLGAHHQQPELWIHAA